MTEPCLICRGRGRREDGEPCAYCRAQGRVEVRVRGELEALMETGSCKLPAKRVPRSRVQPPSRS